MKKIKNILNFRIITLVCIILAVLSTAFIYKIYAADVTSSMKSEGPGMANGQVGAKDYVTVNDLRQRYEIFCSSKGTYLTGDGKATLVTEKGSSDPEYTGKLLPSDKGTKLFETNLKSENTTTPFTKGTYTNNTYSIYTVSEVKICTPMEAYILSEMINNLPNMDNAGLKFVGEENGKRVEYTDTDQIDGFAYIEVNGKKVYMVEDSVGNESMIMQDTDGKYYYVQDSTDQGLGIYSYVQRAWWNTEAVDSLSNPVPSNGLTEEARAFETYISRIAKSMDTSTFVDTDIKVDDSTTITVKAPEIEYEPSYNTNATLNNSNYDLDNPTVSWDDEENIYKIGPFSVNYVEADSAVEGRSAVQFAGITDAHLYTDSSTEALVRGSDWNFIWLSGDKREVGDDYQFPHEDEVFYIGLKDIKDATQITDLSFDFKYMNAGGQFESIKGKYHTLTWTAKSKDNICSAGHTCSHGRINPHSWTTGSGENKVRHYCSGGTACEHGYYREHVESTDYWVELTSASAPKVSQQLAGGLVAARGYETTSIHRELSSLYSGKLIIKKELKDSDGDKIDSNKYFYFKVTVDGAKNSDTSVVKVKANSTVETQYYFWDIGSSAPTYRVEEIPQDGYRCEIENATGTLKNGFTTSTSVKAINYEEANEGYLKVVKKADTSAGNEDMIANQDFNIQIKLSGTFKYDGKSYDNDTLIINTTLKVGQTWTSNGSIKWNKDSEAPKYEVTEIGLDENSNARLVSIVNGNGSIVPSSKKDATLVTVINASNAKSGKLQIIKTLENSELLDEEEVKKLVFTFDITVDGYNKQQVTLNAERSDNGSYVWKYTSDNYYWYGDVVPNYTITEVNNPEGTTFKSAKVDGQEVSVSGSTVTGKLSPDGTNGHTIVNEIINSADIKSGNIELTKHINPEDESLKNNDYRFYITVYGTKFTYKGVTYTENQKVQLTNDSAILLNDAGDYDQENMVVIHVGDAESSTWTSDTFSWVGNAPQYKVEENVLGQDVDYSIEPNQGYLSDKENESDPLKITAWNSVGSKAGYIHIIKTLENADKFTNEYVSNLKFQFKIEVENYESSIVTLNAEKKDNTWVWEYTSQAYSWKADKEAPKYTITEIASDEYELVSITGDGTDVDVSNYKVSGTLKESTSSDVLITTENTFLNKLAKEHIGNIEIDKKVLSDSIKDIEFNFEVTLKGSFIYDGEEIVNGEKVITAKASSNNPWKSSDIKWKGEAPTYTVNEIDIPEINGVKVAEVKSVLNGSGIVKEGETEGVTVVTFINEAKVTGGNLVIEKSIQGGGMNSEDEFYFAIAIGELDEYVVAIKAGETYTSDWITWDPAEEAPDYSVTELPSESAKAVNISNAQGKLSPNTSVTVQAVNEYEENNGNFRIEKFIIADEKLLDGNANATFTIDYIVSSEYTFEIDGKTYGPGSTYAGTVELQGGQSFTSPNIKWYGNHAPIVKVNENISSELADKGWKNVGISNNNAQLTAGETSVITVSNELPTNVIIDLTMNLAGNVWVEQVDENDKNTENSVANGIKDKGEKAPEDLVEVYIYYAGTDTLATIYADISGTVIEQPLYTDIETGNWEAPRIKVPTEISDAYDVVFVYDGQKYEPTKFLVTGDGNANSYIESSNSEKSKFFNDSMALDANREEVNNRIQEIYGNQVIDSNMSTVGSVNGTAGDVDVNYKGELNQSGALGVAGLTQMVSKLQTYDQNTLKVYDLYKAVAKTSIGGLTYPFDVKGYDGIHLENYNTTIDQLGITQEYQYQAIYKYCQHINLGLVTRDESDVEINKDLESASVVINNTKTDYIFNKLDDFGKDCLTRKIQAETNNITYQLGLYQTDYYYRAEMYKQDATVYDTLLTAYTDYKSLKDTEMEVFLNYRITVYNSSGNYIAKFNSVNDYFDSSYVAPISENTYVNVKDENGNLNPTLVAQPSYLQKVNSSDKTNVAWTAIPNEQNVMGSDGITYNGYSIDLGGLQLNPGEYADIHVSFKVSKDTIEGVQDAIVLGNKSNIVEIANYSILNLDGSNAGKIDGDSAPANIDIRNHNDKTWYEDDTDQAPILKLELQETQRQINGVAWEDKVEDNTQIGNGVYDSDEAVIAGLTTQVVEKIPLNNVEYDFIWPTNMSLDQLGGKTLEELTGFDSTIETSRISDPDNGIGYGSYRFNAVPTGNYAVRFLYGIEKTDLEDNFDVSGAPVALDANGNLYSGNENILTANYDQDKENYTAAVYNGQDYKTTINQNETLNNRYYNINSDETLRINDAIDSETRRLTTIANSQIITNTIAKELMTANYKDSVHTGLYNNYNMFADTPIIKITTEAEKDDGTTIKGNTIENGSLQVNNDIKSYNVNNVDCGLIERPETNIVLDKQISSVSLTTNDGNVIFDAKYNVNYDIVSESSAQDKTIISKLDNNKYLVADVKLSEESIGTDILQAVNKTENKITSEDKAGEENFRFIQVEDSILQGTQIDIKYQLTAINISDLNYTTEELASKSAKQEILDLAKETKTNIPDLTKTLEIGKYLGSYYYTGDSTNNTIVKTKVRQVVDYIDNDAVFSEVNNQGKDASWKRTTITELSGSGVEADRLVDVAVIPEYSLTDSYDREYVTDSNQNIVLSVDNQEELETNSNIGFEKDLVPFTGDADSEDYRSTITLQVSRVVSAGDITNASAKYDFENVAEIVKFENDVGRRDEASVAGNANPHLGEFTLEPITNFERDTSATEVVTFTPPTGIDSGITMQMQVLIVVAGALMILVVGIIIIKKSVLKK